MSNDRPVTAAEDLPGPEYPNSPLQGVVFEIRFPGEHAIECHRDEFFNDARAEFPNVFVPKLKSGDAAALSPYHFQNPEGTGSLLTALNLFAYRTSAYSGYARFEREALKWMKVFADRFHISTLNRTGLRYTNIIPYAPGATFPMSDFVDVSVKLGVVESASFSGFSLDAVIPADGGQLTVAIQQLKTEGSDDSAILLDFDFSMVGNLDFSDVETYLRNSHEQTKRLFEGLLTSSYRSFLRGEGLE